MIKCNMLKTNIEVLLMDCLNKYNINYEREYITGDEEELDTIKLITNDYVIWIHKETLQLIDKHDKKKEIYREIWDYKSKNEDEMVDDFLQRVEIYLKTFRKE
jgi:hypothetical protein